MPRAKPSGDDIGSAFGPNWEHLLQDLEEKTPAPPEDYQRAAPGQDGPSRRSPVFA